jgi:hypothetical protein
MRWARHVTHMKEDRKVYKVLVGEPKGKRPLRRPKRRWEDGIRMDLRETGWGMWSGFGWLRTGISGGLLRTLMNIRVLKARSSLHSYMKVSEYYVRNTVSRRKWTYN